MLLLTQLGGLHLGDMIFQLLFFSVLLAIVTGIVMIFRKFKRRNEQLSRVEEKVDKLLSDKDK
ncbi:DUF4083 family protein [Virgibacillus flavescens]|uniref:DUF4083 family protein n=1 Tax=Virgibacillus flavescens TaxID=1611422 RepID=UPI003D34B6BC